MRLIAPLLSALAAGAGGYLFVARGAVTLDLGVGRRVRPLGLIARTIAAPPETVFDIIAAPYLGRTPRALKGKVDVWERGADMVLAAHFTAVGRFTTTTVETVRFERPHTISFRLLRGPVPHVIEAYDLRPAPRGTSFTYRGEIGADSWRLGEWWAGQVAGPSERTVAAALDVIQAEAERRAVGRSPLTR